MDPDLVVDSSEVIAQVKEVVKQQTIGKVAAAVLKAKARNPALTK